MPEESDRVAKFTRWVAIFTGLLAFVALLQLCSMNSADEANRNTQRAFVYPKTPSLSAVINELGQPTNPPYHMRVFWENAGSTPTRDLQIYEDYRFVPISHDQYTYPTFDAAKSKKTFIPPKALVDVPVTTFTADQLINVKGGNKYLYIFSLAKYRDIFPGHPVHITHACWKMDVNTFEAINLAQPMTNLVQPRAGQTETKNLVVNECLQDNCTDYECERSPRSGRRIRPRAGSR
jgi:hypothetical protein